MRETNIIPRESWKKKKIFNFSQPGLENIHKNLNDNVTIEIIIWNGILIQWLSTKNRPSRVHPRGGQSKKYGLWKFGVKLIRNFELNWIFRGIEKSEPHCIVGFLFSNFEIFLWFIATWCVAGRSVALQWHALTPPGPVPFYQVERWATWRSSSFHQVDRLVTLDQ